MHNILCDEVYTGTMVWGESAKDKAEPVRVEKALPAIISKSQFRQVNKQMRSRAPRTAHPRNLVETTDLDIDDFKPRIREGATAAP